MSFYFFSLNTNCIEEISPEKSEEKYLLGKNEIEIVASSLERIFFLYKGKLHRYFFL